MAMKPKSDDHEMAPEHLSEQQSARQQKLHSGKRIDSGGRKSPTVTLRIKARAFARALFPYPRDA
jgi:hypothetical protein